MVIAAFMVGTVFGAIVAAISLAAYVNSFGDEL